MCLVGCNLLESACSQMLGVLLIATKILQNLDMNSMVYKDVVTEWFGINKEWEGKINSSLASYNLILRKTWTFQ